MLRSVMVSGVLVALVVAGCSAAPEAGQAGDDQNVTAGACGTTPCPAKTDFEQAKVCDNLFAGDAEIRQADLDEGVVRWKCGDVEHVLQPDLGQEYCEYHAIAVNTSTKSAIVVDNASDLSKAKGATVQCLYTSVYGDVRDDVLNVAGNLLIKNKQSADYDQSHVADVQKELGVTSLGLLPSVTAAVIDEKGKTVENHVFDKRAVTGMYGRFNTRGAATSLLDTCQQAAAGSSVNADRTAACFLASKAATAAGDAAKAASLTTACTGVNLATDAAWSKVAALGVKLGDPANDAAYQTEKDISACIRTKEGGGVSWRNSDPTICARTLRAAGECGAKFGALPDKPNFIDGFEMTGWNGRSLEGTGCKYVHVAGKEYRNLVVCTPPAAEIDKAINRIKRPLQQVCNDLFGNVVAMQAPIGAVVTTKADAKGSFCGSFNKGVAAIKSKIGGK